jgi:hypothetical protein
MVYEEVRGTDRLVRHFLAMPARFDSGNEEFVVIRPGGEVKEEMFRWPGAGAAVAANARKL